jgi:acetyltransferase-like isoleucine patch superfamily enzyme
MSRLRARTTAALRTRLRSVLQGILWERDATTGWIDTSRVTMGRYSYHMPNVVYHEEETTANVTIGSFCSIAQGVRFLLDGEHRQEFITTHPLTQLVGKRQPLAKFTKGSTVVGDDVWIGQWATILSGVTIGTGAVIGACAVVASDVRPFAVVVGNPAREIRRRFSDEDIERVLATEWWIWPEAQLLEALPLLWSSDVDGLVEYSRSRGG